MGSVACSSGDRFERLTAIKRVGVDKHGKSIWLFNCDCGNQHAAMLSDVKSGKTRSCGCLAKESSLINIIGARKNARVASTTHGMCGTRLHSIYANMKQRCCNPKNMHYKDYGGRGIIICAEWLNNIQSFFDWAMGHGYGDDLQIDRADNDKGYSPDNCQWVPQDTQKGNTRRNVFISIGGKTKTMSEWARAYGIGSRMVQKRIKRGWSPADAVTIPAWEATHD